jgi:hypothetical protein
MILTVRAVDKLKYLFLSLLIESVCRICVIPIFIATPFLQCYSTITPVTRITGAFSRQSSSAASLSLR